MKGVKDMKKFFKSVFCLILSFAIISSLAVLVTAETELPVEIKAKAAEKETPRRPRGVSFSAGGSVTPDPSVC
jgi:hypothetical protein